MLGRVKIIIQENSVKNIVNKIFKRIILKSKYFFHKFCFHLNINKSKDFYYDSNMEFHYNNSQLWEIKNFYRGKNKLKNKVLREADLIIENSFSILGENIKSKLKIQWNKDYKSNFCWENDFYKDIKTINLKNRADVKMPWELSRFQHLFTVGKAYWISGDKKYYIKSRQDIESWDKENPYLGSVNWTCAMEVGIRAINFLFFYNHFKNEIDNDELFKMKFNRILFQHGLFIFDNLENYSEERNNHYLSNLVGLIYLGIYFKDSDGKVKRKSKKWLKFSIEELEKEAYLQTNSDGTNYEGTTSYHRLVLELFLYTNLICEVNGIALKKIPGIINKMNKFLIDIMKPNELFPLIGDADNGRLVIISNYFDWNKKKLSHHLNFTNEVTEEEIWISGLNKFSREFNKDVVSSAKYDSGGFYILRNDYFYTLIRCGKLSMNGQGGHSHNDQLSFVLNVLGRDFFIDPGSYTYTGSALERNNDRSTFNHNTLWIPGFEQNNFYNDLFSMKEESFGKELDFKYDYFEGEHYGYQKKGKGIHNRKIFMSQHKLKVFDNLHKVVDEHTKAYQILVLDSNVEIIYGDEVLFLKNDKVILKTNIDKTTVKVEEVNISEGYGKKIKSKKLLIKYKKNKPLIFEIKKEEKC